jgi:hypothetical protein
MPIIKKDPDLSLLKVLRIVFFGDKNIAGEGV